MIKRKQSAVSILSLSVPPACSPCQPFQLSPACSPCQSFQLSPACGPCQPFQLSRFLAPARFANESLNTHSLPLSFLPTAAPAVSICIHPAPHLAFKMPHVRLKSLRVGMINVLLINDRILTTFNNERRLFYMNYPARLYPCPVIAWRTSKAIFMG